MEAMERRLVDYERAWQDGTASKSAPVRAQFKDFDGEPGDESRLERDFEMIDREIRYKGFFAFASNSISTAREALEIYRGRDCVEKIFFEFADWTGSLLNSRSSRRNPAGKAVDLSCCADNACRTVLRNGERENRER